MSGDDDDDTCPVCDGHGCEPGFNWPLTESECTACDGTGRKNTKPLPTDLQEVLSDALAKAGVK